jgi:class 3 adenylate cyclase
VCARCGRGNPAGQNFCHGCGASLGRPDAALEDAGAGPVSSHLAEEILRSRPALEGERKQVTVLFADVKGSMDLAGQMDPERWSRIMRRFFRVLSDGVERFEGFVDKFTGDGIMALFGAPLAHEDHAERACWAALALRQQLERYGDELRREEGFNFSVRIGIHSGEVVVGRITDDLRMHYTAQGHTVGLAQRMESLAAPGQVYLTEHTARLVGAYFELRDLGRFQVKGLGEPITVFQLDGTGPLHTRLDRSRRRGLSRFLGRGEEMRVLEAALARAARGNGQAVGVVAEAGVGKSRLCFEFLEACRARGHEVLQARGVAHGRSITLLPILELMRQFFRITEHDDDQAARERIAGRLLLLDESFREALPLLFEFLGVPDPARPAPRMDPGARQRRLFAITRQLIQAPPGEHDPTVLLIEDLHWIDPATEAFVEIMMDAVAGASLLLLWNFRPEHHAAWMSRPYYQQIALGPLGPHAMRELVADRLGTDPSLAGLAERIDARAHGNPFFAEEVIQSLIESGAVEGGRGRYRLARPIGEIEVPAAAHALLAARIDRLASREKRSLQTAAVIGKEFPLSVLARVLDLGDGEIADALRALQAAQFVYEEALYPEVEYAFRHPLTQEVAYRSLLTSHRAALHRRIAEALEALTPAERLDEKAALLAHHLAEAGEALAAARWRARAADYVAMNAPNEALAHWRAARLLLRGADETPEVLALRTRACGEILARSYRVGIPLAEQEEIFREGCAAAQRIDDARGHALLLIGRGSTDVSGDASLYVRYADEAAAAAAAVGDEGFRFTLQSVDRAYARIYVARFDEVIAIADAAIERAGGRVDLGREVYNFSPLLCLGLLRCWALIPGGRLREARQQLDRVMEATRRYGEEEVLSWVLGVSVMLEETTGEVELGLRHALEAVEISERIGSPFSRVFSFAWLSVAQLLRSDAKAALEAAERALAITHSERTALGFEPVTIVRRAEALLAMGEVAAARNVAAEAVACARERGVKLYEPQALLVQVEALIAGEPSLAGEAASAVEQGLAVATGTGARVWVPRFHEARAKLASLRGDDAERERERQLACRLDAELGASGHARRLALEVAPLAPPG